MVFLYVLPILVFISTFKFEGWTTLNMYLYMYMRVLRPICQSSSLQIALHNQQIIQKSIYFANRASQFHFTIQNPGYSYTLNIFTNL